MSGWKVSLLNNMRIRRNESQEKDSSSIRAGGTYCLLQGNDAPFLRNVFFDGAFFAPSRSRNPVQNAEACLLK